MNKLTFEKLYPRFVQGYTGQSLFTIVPTGVYNSVAPTLTNGQTYQLGLDVNGNVLTSSATLTEGEDTTNHVMGIIQKPVVTAGYSGTLFVSFGTITKANVKASPGQVLSVVATNANASVRFFQIHNKASAPAGADVPVVSIPIPAGTTNQPGYLFLDNSFFLQNGEYLSTGVGWAISTTVSTFTDSATAADHTVNGHYI